MLTPNLGFVLLFVENPVKSSQFYNKILNLNPIQESPTFVLYALTNGIMLGLWSRHTAEPIVQNEPGASEICFATNDVDTLYGEWQKIGISFAQEPTDMNFGRTFVALDPDGHRIRILK